MSFNRLNNRGPNGSANPGNRPVCKFYLEGRCRYGDACHNYHPPRDSSQGQALPYHLTRDGIKGDLTFGEDRPTWPMSAYGPGKDAPRQLLEGVLEQSPEELRVQYYLAKASGSTQQYEQTEQSALSTAGERVQQILNDLDGAIKFVIDGKDAHPNRDDVVVQPTVAFNWVKRPSFDANAASTTSGTRFGQQPSAFGNNTSSAFGKPPTAASGTAFGQASAAPGFGGQSGGAPGFGAPSALGGGSTAFGRRSSLGGGSTAFGQPSALGGGSPFGAQNATSTSAFGQASAPAGNKPFGQASNAGTSPFGQASATGTGTAFGQPSALGGGSTFGKPSPFGAAASNAPAFGQSGFGSAPSTSAPVFGQASQSSPQPSAFGQPSQVGPSTSAFGQPSQPGQQSSPFGQTQTTSAFGQPSQPGQQQSSFGRPSSFSASSTSGAPAFGQTSFGSPSPLGAASSTNPAFGQPSAPAQQKSPFGTSTSNQPTPFGAAATPANPNPFATSKPAPSTFGTATTTTPQQPGQPLTSFRGHPVIRDSDHLYYRNPATGKNERIFMETGPPGPNPDVEASAETYEALGDVLKRVYEYVRETGRFEGGVMPEVPPRREWVGWEV